MQLDLKKLPFGQMLSRHLLFEEDDPQKRGYEKGYWLALANESSNMFGFGAAARFAGLIRIQATVNGEVTAAELSATHAIAELKNSAGRIRFAIDGPALLLEGNGLGLKLRVKVGPGEVASKTDTGCILSIGATRYIMEMKKGSCNVDTSWNLIGLTSNDPVLTLVPENGQLEAVFWDCDTTYRKSTAAESVSAAAAKAEQSFTAFRSTVYGTNELYTYVLWLAHMQLQGQMLIINNKLGDARAVLRNQCLAALAFKGAEKAFELILAQLRLMTRSGLVPIQVKSGAITPEATVPMWGYALLQIRDWSTIPTKKLEECDALMHRAVGWWETNRQTKEGEFFYAYTHESGWEHSGLVPDASPAISPDLAGWMAFNYTALSKLAELLGKPDAARMREYAAAQIQVLQGLWNGDNYVCRSAVGESVFPCTAALGLLTRLLGKTLPTEIASKLNNWEYSSPSKLMAGLLALHCPKESAILVAAGAENSTAGAASCYDPTLCAILLALEERR